MVPLGEVVKPTRPRVKPADYPERPFIGMEHIEAHSMKLLGTVPARTMRSSAVHFQPGDVLYGRLRPYLNKVYRPSFEGLCSAEFIVLPENERVDGAYLQYFLNSSAFVRYASHLNSGDRPRVDFDQMAPYEIPLPPKSEQRRIVAEIEKQCSRLDEAAANLMRVKANLKRYKAAVLKAAVEGRLVPTEAELARREHRSYESGTELLRRILEVRRTHWTGRVKYKEPLSVDTTHLPLLPDGWVWASVNELIAHLTDGDHQPPPQAESGVPFLVIGNVRTGEITFTGSRFVRQEYYMSIDESRRPRKGDLLYTLVGSYGIPAAVKTDKRFCIQRHIAILRPHHLSPMSYLAICMASDLVFKQATEVATGTAQLTVPLAGLRTIAVPLPPIPEQLRIVNEVHRRLSLIQDVDNEVAIDLRRTESLRQATLGHKFSLEQGAHVRSV